MSPKDLKDMITKNTVPKEKNEDLVEAQVIAEIDQLKDKKGFLNAGKPVFDRLFGRDALIAAWQLLDRDPEVARDTLEILSELQGQKIDLKREEEPGKIIHETDLSLDEHPNIENFPFPYYGSVDSTPLYLIVFAFYFRKTKNEDFLNRHWENILSAVNWMEEYGDEDNDFFLEYSQHNPNGLVNQCWKDSEEFRIKMPIAIVEAQGYEYLALKEISRLARVKGDLMLTKKLNERAEKLKKAFNAKFWMEDEGYYALALDGDKKQETSVTSNPGHLLFTGIVDTDKADRVVERLFKEDLFTPCGIRTHSSFEPDFNVAAYHCGSVWPHDNWIISQGLKNLGYKKEYREVKEAIIRAHEEMGYLPEFYQVVDEKATVISKNKPCYPQAWASGTLLNFLEER